LGTGSRLIKRANWERSVRPTAADRSGDGMAKVKKENTILKMENEILKKAAAYFARESLPGMRT